MPGRDPQTGQFVANAESHYDDLEQVSWSVNTGISAADLTGATAFDGGDIGTFEGLQVLDYDDIADRSEHLELIMATHRVVVYSNSTATADGTVKGVAEISTSPSRDIAIGLFGASDIADSNIVQSVGTDQSDSIDIVGPPLVAVAHAPFSDGASGVGGGGAAGDDTLEHRPPQGRLATFDPRDELFLNGAIEVWNIDDAGVHMDVHGQHLYGVIED